jgi:hypothetical protein
LHTGTRRGYRVPQGAAASILALNGFDRGLSHSAFP